MVAAAVKREGSKSKFYYIAQGLSHDQDILYVSFFIACPHSIIAL